MSTIAPPRPTVHYPDCDGLPMSDNTLQFEWISTLKWNLEALFRDRADVFVAGDHLIYPVEGNNTTRQAPDTYVVFGPAKGHRGSYKVWDEGDVFPQVVFEVWSPGNRFDDMLKKFRFYERYGAEEYYLIYPDFPAYVDAYRRVGERLVEIEAPNGYVSPRLGIRFELILGQLAVYGPDGRRFLTPVEIAAERDRAEDQARTERERVARLAAKLRELGIDPDQV